MNAVPQMVDILLVEDNPDDIQLTLHALQKHKVTNSLKIVEDGAEALDFLMSRGLYAGRPNDLPNVVVLDLKLPKISGVEVLRQIRSNPRMARIPVVVLTSSREDADIQRCYELGVNSYIVKPLDFTQFSDAVRQVGLYWLLLNQAPRLQ